MVTICICMESIMLIFPMMSMGMKGVGAQGDLCAASIF
jgi:hypothetical protein